MKIEGSSASHAPDLTKNKLNLGYGRTGTHIANLGSKMLDDSVGKREFRDEKFLSLYLIRPREEKELPGYVYSVCLRIRLWLKMELEGGMSFRKG
jgi:hypothetical protein